MAKGTEESYMQKYYQQQVEQNERKIANLKGDALKNHDGYFSMRPYEKVIYNDKAKIKALKKEHKQAVGKIVAEKKTEKLKESLKEHNKLLKSVVEVNGKQYARTEESRKKSFIPKWAKKFTQRCVQEGDEIDALYVASVYYYFTANYNEPDATKKDIIDGYKDSDWFFLSRSVAQQLYLFNDDREDNILHLLSNKSKAALVVNGDRPDRDSAAVKSEGITLKTVVDYLPPGSYLRAVGDVDPAKVKAKYFDNYINNVKYMSDEKLLEAVAINKLEIDASGKDKTVEDFIKDSDAYKVYLLNDTEKKDRRLDWMKKHEEKDPLELKYFMYINTMLHQSGFKLLDGVPEFIEKHGGQVSSCIIDDGDDVSHTVDSRAIRLLSNFYILHDIILNGEVMLPGPDLEDLVPCDLEYLQQQFLTYNSQSRDASIPCAEPGEDRCDTLIIRGTAITTASIPSVLNHTYVGYTCCLPVKSNGVCGRHRFVLPTNSRLKTKYAALVSSGQMKEERHSSGRKLLYTSNYRVTPSP